MRTVSVSCRCMVLALWACALACACAGSAQAGPYLLSAHGDETIGVLRSGMQRYPRGHCAQCHEQHASVDGSEPAPTGGPDEYLLFGENTSGQTVNVCYLCHVAAGGYQSGDISINRSYSYNFGGNTGSGSYDEDIADQFAHTVTGSSHYLPSIVSQVLGKTMYDADGASWSLPADLNPCDTCHNPHLAQRNYPVDLSSGSLRTAISRPSDHENLWGDDAGERMSVWGDYKAPKWYHSNNRYEPDESTTTDGSNLPDYPTLCTDCHNTNVTLYSENPRMPNAPRNLYQIDWSTGGNKHGARDSSAEYLMEPYTQGTTLSCTDCHEPHGSVSNIYLLRTSVNGEDTALLSESPSDMSGFCIGVCHSEETLNVSPHNKPSGEDCIDCHNHDKTRF